MEADDHADANEDFDKTSIPLPDHQIVRLKDEYLTSVVCEEFHNFILHDGYMLLTKQIMVT